MAPIPIAAIFRELIVTGFSRRGQTYSPATLTLISTKCWLMERRALFLRALGRVVSIHWMEG